MRTFVAGAAATTALALVAAAAPAMAADEEPTSLASVLLSDGNTFDKNHQDFDIVTEAALAVLEAKPDSAVSVLTDGTVPLTAFIPNDRAFMLLVKSLTGTMPSTERKTFKAVAGLGIDTVETVLLYHVVPGAKINAKTALKSDGATLTTAADGLTVKVKVRHIHGERVIKLRDKDRDARNPRVIVTNINKGRENMQIAHGIDRVLRPVDL